MNGLKLKNLRAAYTGFAGPRTFDAVWSQVPDELREQLTGKQLGLVMSAINAAYHKGKSACGAEVIDGDAIWITPLDGLFELSDIKANVPTCGQKTRPN